MSDKEREQANGESFADISAEGLSAGVSEDSETPEKPDAPSRKKSRKKLWITLGVIVFVLVLAGGGGTLWHQHPSFCNFICHQPMDSYVEGFYSDDPNLLVTAHAEKDVECLDCHEATIGEQMTEAVSWVSGSYKDPLPMTKIGTREFCLTCHDDGDATTGIDWTQIIESTKDYNGTARNPHDSHYGDALDCFSCHRSHRASTMYCNTCHPDIKGPTGWV